LPYPQSCPSNPQFSITPMNFSAPAYLLLLLID
jgi:hypothetical protein